jgi:hypothetical protein
MKRNPRPSFAKPEKPEPKTDDNTGYGQLGRQHAHLAQAGLCGRANCGGGL